VSAGTRSEAGGEGDGHGAAAAPLVGDEARAEVGRQRPHHHQQARQPEPARLQQPNERPQHVTVVLTATIDYFYTSYERQPIWRSGGNTRLLRKTSRVRFPHSANICVHEHVYLYWVWVFLCIICMYLQKKCI
jgi:hypothetical protein